MSSIIVTDDQFKIIETNLRPILYNRPLNFWPCLTWQKRGHVEATKVTYSSIVVFQIRSNHIDSIAAIVHLKTISRKKISPLVTKSRTQADHIFSQKNRGSVCCMFIFGFLCYWAKLSNEYTKTGFYTMQPIKPTEMPSSSPRHLSMIQTF